MQRPRRVPLQRSLFGVRIGRGLLTREGGEGDALDAVGVVATVLLRGLRAAMSRILALAYGVASYLLFLASFLYVVGFVGNLLVPKSIDSGLFGSRPAAVLVDTLLLLLFAVPHSVMARPAFKSWWTRYIPPPVERSTFVLVSSLTLGFLFWQWQPIPSVLWHVVNPVGRWLLNAVFWTGWTIALVSTFLIDHCDLFG